MVAAEIQEGKPSQVSTFTVLACIMSDHTSLTKASHMIKPRVNGMEVSTRSFYWEGLQMDKAKSMDIKFHHKEG